MGKNYSPASSSIIHYPLSNIIIGARQDLRSRDKALTEGKPCHISRKYRLCGLDNRKNHIKFWFTKSQRMFRAVGGSQMTQIL